MAVAAQNGHLGAIDAVERRPFARSLSLLQNATASNQDTLSTGRSSEPLK